MYDHGSVTKSNSCLKNLFLSTLFWNLPKVESRNMASHTFYSNNSTFDCRKGHSFSFGEIFNKSIDGPPVFVSLTHNHINNHTNMKTKTRRRLDSESKAFNISSTIQYRTVDVVETSTDSILFGADDTPINDPNNNIVKYDFYGDHFTFNDVGIYGLITNIIDANSKKLYGLVTHISLSGLAGPYITFLDSGDNIFLTAFNRDYVSGGVAFIKSDKNNHLPGIKVLYFQNTLNEDVLANLVISNLIQINVEITTNFPFSLNSNRPLVSAGCAIFTDFNLLYISILSLESEASKQYQLLLYRSRLSGISNSELDLLSMGKMTFTSTSFLSVLSVEIPPVFDDSGLAVLLKGNNGNVLFNFLIDDNGGTLSLFKPQNIDKSISILRSDGVRRLAEYDIKTTLQDFEDAIELEFRGMKFNKIRNHFNLFGNLKLSSSNKSLGFILEAEAASFINGSADFVNGFIFEDDGHHLESQLGDIANDTCYVLAFCFCDSLNLSSVRYHVINKTNFEPVSEDCEDFFTRAVFKLSYIEDIVSNITINSSFTSIPSFTLNNTNISNSSNISTPSIHKGIENLCEMDDFTKSPVKDDGQKDADTDTNDSVWYLAVAIGVPVLIIALCCFCCYFKFNAASKTYYNID